MAKRKFVAVAFTGKRSKILARTSSRAEANRVAASARRRGHDASVMLAGLESIMAKRKKRRRRSSGLGEVTKKDFQAIATALCRNNASSGLVDDLTSYFASQNPRFDASRFQKATRTCR